MTTTSPTAQRATINDVARAANVSRQTVSNVVNRPERVAATTRERVEAEIARLGYRPSSAAKSLRQQRAGAVGIELNTLGESSRSDIVYPFVVELSIHARQHQCHIVTFGSDSDAPSLAGYEQMVRARLVDAFVLADTHHGDPRPEYLRSQRIPFAAFGRLWDEPETTTWADVDGRAGMRLGVRHLQDAGYDRIAYLGWPEGSALGDDRRQGWSDGLAASGRLDDALSLETPQDLVEARRVAETLLDHLRPGDAVLAVSDVVALGVCQALHGRGLRPGRDIGVVGFDGSSLAALHDVTTLVQPLTEVTEHVLGIIAALLGGASAPEQGYLVAPTLRPRSSSQRT